MHPDELRTKYLRFFEEKGHTVVPSDSLVPRNDPTLLFTGAGMNQFKELFLGKVKNPPYRRAASSQKCIRTGDIENVGRTPYHHTFFEMLGNFSFGDYFKREAIHFAWEFLTKVLKMDPARLRPTVYLDDDEAFAVWHKEIGIPAAEIPRLGAGDNFWPANAPAEGPNGPCGPCSEIYFDQGREFGCGKPTCGPACDCKRYCEIWNLVFTQFDRRDGGALEPLPQKNIDTGMGFERLMAVLHGGRTNFDTELFQPILREAAALVGTPYGKDVATDQRLRRIADHARAVTFLIADGVLPSNEGRGYVERRLLRRAVNDGIQLGLEEPFLHRLAKPIAEIMTGPYPEIGQNREHVEQIVRGEEERFRATYRQGLDQLDRHVEYLRGAGQKVFPGRDLFVLYDTFGFPPDLAEALLADRGMAVDKAGFEEAMEEQRKRARSASVIAKEIFATGPLLYIKNESGPTRFVGYDARESEGQVVGLLREGKVEKEVRGPAEIEVVVDRSPFYAEMGGQVGDTGRLEGKDAQARVTDTRGVDGYILHKTTIAEGAMRRGEKVRLAVDAPRRDQIERNHTGTHLLHAALREVLGTHVRQAGSLVAPDRLRFDFSHPRPVTPEEALKIEERINEVILQDLEVRASEGTLEEARRRGAMALFGEKYGDRVRMIEVPGFSLELCGGTHVGRVGQIGAVSLVSEGSVAAGVRRIEAVSGTEVPGRGGAARESLAALARRLGGGEEDLLRRLDALEQELRDLRKGAEKQSGQRAEQWAKDLLAHKRDLGPVHAYVKFFPGATGDELRALVDSVRRQDPLAVVATASDSGAVVVGWGKAAAPHQPPPSGELAALMARHMGGGGGGRPDFAQGQGKDHAKAEEALRQGERALQDWGAKKKGG
jgi:alanyl-tRNA synthetase